MAMEFEYGCQTANKYMFFEENEVEDPSELLAQVAKKEEAPKAKAPAGKTAAKPEAKGKAPAGKDTKKPLQQTTENKQAGRGQQRGGQKPGSAPQAPREDKENTSNRPQGERRPQRPRQEGEGGEVRPRPERRGPRPDRPERQEGDGPRTDRPPRRYPPRQPAEGEVQQGDEEGRGQRRGYGASGRAGFRFRRANDSNQRDFDRHSGSDRTGVKSVDKREGAGKANWGTPQDDLAGAEEAQHAVEETKAEETGDWATRVEESEEKKEEEAKDEQSSYMTLAEYKALKQEVSKRNEFNIRQPGEGEDQAKWGKGYVLKKKVEEEEEAEDEEEDEEEVDEDEEKKRQLLNSIQIKFNEPASVRGAPRGGRGGRGGFRGRREEGEAPPTEQSPEKRGQSGRGRGGRPQGGRGGNNQPRVVVPKIEDEQDFPSLGK